MILYLIRKQTFIANKSPVALFRVRKTRPNAPLLMGFIISKSSIEVRSLEQVLIGLARRLRTASSSTELSSSATLVDESTFSSSICPQRDIYFSLQNEVANSRLRLSTMPVPENRLEMLEQNSGSRKSYRNFRNRIKKISVCRRSNKKVTGAHCKSFSIRRPKVSTIRASTFLS